MRVFGCIGVIGRYLWECLGVLGSLEDICESAGYLWKLGCIGVIGRYLWEWLVVFARVREDICESA